MIEATTGIAGAFLASVAQHENRIALWARDESLTYAQLRARSASIACALSDSARVKPGDRVAILADRTTTAYVSVLAALLAGTAYVPLNPRYPAERNRVILVNSGAKALIVDDRNLSGLEVLLDSVESKPLIVTPESADVPLNSDAMRLSRKDLPRDVSDASLRIDRHGNDLAYVLFTSGSTGVPKGVPISHSNLAAYVANTTALAKVSCEDRIIQLADLTFDISVHDMFVSWLNGASLFSVPENATLMATRFVQELGITGWFSVPSTAGLLKQSGFLTPGTLPTLRFTLFCGEALTGMVAEAWAEAAPNAAVFNLYGPTEATVAFTSFRYQSGQADPPAIVPLGEPFHGQSVGLFEADGVPTVVGGTGEICLSGSQVAAQYWNAPELTAQRFFYADGRRWYRTGDLGRYDPKVGYLFAGRLDQQVKIRGYRVELQEIEGAVRKASGCDLVAVLPWPMTQDRGATGCVAFVAGVTGDAELVRRECQRYLPDYMVPSHIIYLPEMPLNANGKIDSLRLRAHPALSPQEH